MGNLEMAGSRELKVVGEGLTKPLLRDLSRLRRTDNTLVHPLVFIRRPRTIDSGMLEARGKAGSMKYIEVS